MFNIAINNVDDHVNNTGFLHVSHDQWEMAPAFDLNPFPDKERALNTWISDTAGDEASSAHALTAAPLFGLSPNAAKAVLADVTTAFMGWKAEAQKLGMTSVDIRSFAPAFQTV